MSLQKSVPLKPYEPSISIGMGRKVREGFNVNVLLSLYFILTVIGLVNLYSAADGGFYFWSQLWRTGLGFLFFLFFAYLVPIRHINTYGYLIHGVIFLLLILVLIIGNIAGGAQRWIQFAGLSLQPSELAKLTIAVFTAKFCYSQHFGYSHRLRDLWPLLLSIGLTFGVVFIQPDLGTAGVCLLIPAFQLMFVRIELRSVAIVAGLGFATSAIGWLFFLHDYQKLRILNLLNPNLDPHGSGYNSIQSLVAVGSGGYLGKGFLAGSQAQLQFLPARHTDFIFSVFAEENGFWLSLLVFFCFAFLTYVILDLGRRAADSFCSLLAVGIGGMIFVEFFINVAMVLGIFPVVGMPLPFFSYGGSSLLTNHIAMGLMVSLSRFQPGVKERPPWTALTSWGRNNVA